MLWDRGYSEVNPFPVPGICVCDLRAGSHFQHTSTPEVTCPFGHLPTNIFYKLLEATIHGYPRVPNGNLVTFAEM